MRRLGLVRHGESTANAEGWLAGWVDAPLTARGEAQAHALQPQLSAWAPERIVTSTLERAWRTASLAWPHAAPPIERHAALRERHIGAWERVPRAELKADGRLRHLVTFDGHAPGGESQRDLGRRLLTWLAAHDDGRDTLLVVHGGVMRVLLGLLDGTPPESIGTLKIDNTAFHERDVRPERWSALLESL